MEDVGAFCRVSQLQEFSKNSNRAEYENPHFKHLVIAYTGKHGLDRRMPINIL